MSKIIIWDAGEADKNKRYTVVCGKMAYVAGDNATEDSSNIEIIPKSLVEEKWMDANCKRILPRELPEDIRKAIIKIKVG